MLAEIFEHYPEESEEKAMVALSIGRFGGEEAVTFLENALESTRQRQGTYARQLKMALETAKENRN